MRIRHQLLVTSHRFRIFILASANIFVFLGNETLKKSRGFENSGNDGEYSKFRCLKNFENVEQWYMYID